MISIKERKKMLEEHAALQSRVTEFALTNTCLRGQLQEARDAARALSSFMLMSIPASALPGVYFLLDERGEVVYVGQSGNVALRLAGHAEKQFTHIRMLHIPDVCKRDKFERKMIELLQPVLNVALCPGRGRKEMVE